MIRESGCGRRFAAAGTLQPHRNRGIELCRIRSGLYRWQVEGGPVSVLAPGDGFVTLPWQVHGGEDGVMHRGVLDFVVIGLDRCGPGGSWSFGDWCHLDREARRFIESTLLGNHEPVLRAAPCLGTAFDRFWDELHQARPGWRGQCRALAGELLLAAARATAGTTRHEDDAGMRAALRGITGRLGEPWDLAEMAGVCGLGRTRFAERLHALTGLSPRRWLLRTRLEAAAAALRQGRRQVTTIALDLGFASSQHLATAFRREFGTTPRQWRGAQPAGPGADAS